ncbi:MAG: hypothetical protein SFV17_08970 [Candidatus Obscuribacter sp.]|nr:hypothetical protein [Candidatus Melainabacteria bacterium]MDX1986807.1 hypothetical protein [Candidatus Obscuribacter sp.]
MRNIIIFAVSSTLLQVASPAFAEHFKVGDRVDADVMHIGIWKSGVITEVLPFERYRVQLDEEVGRYEPTVCLERFIRAGAGGSQANKDAAPKTSYTGGAALSGQFKVGQRVMADATRIGNFKPGTITELLPYGRFRVQFDDEIGRYEPTVITEGFIKAADNLSPPKTDVNAGPQTGAHKSAPVQAIPHTPPATKISTKAAGDEGEGLPEGKGAPPSGKYVAQKISPGGQLMGLGNLEIRGNSYRGIAGGGMAPFSVSGGNIVWSAGITGLPEGWVIRKSVYRGLDHMGRPYIQVYYRSKSGFNDCFDCVRE